MDKDRIVMADSGSLSGYFGILNAHGQFWSHTVHRNPEAAKRFIREFWGENTEQAESCLKTHRIVPVRVRLTAVPEAGRGGLSE